MKRMPFWAIFVFSLLFTNPSYADYELGPYPVPFEQDGIKTNFMVWLKFTPVVEGRVNSTYKLLMSVRVQVDQLPSLLGEYAAKNLDHDNCARYSIDNWVYNIHPQPLQILNQQHTLRLYATGNFQTWSCSAGPDTVVCDHYKDSLGIEWPYNCRTQRGSNILVKNLEQDFNMNKDFYLNVTKDGKLQFLDSKPIINFTGGIGGDALNALAFLFNNFSAICQNAFSVKTIEMNVPNDYKILNPKYEFGGFTVIDGHEFIVVSASVSLTTLQLNDFMRKHFGALWHDLAQSASSPKSQMTRSILKQECSKYDPSEDIRTCAAKMGWDYNLLPD